MACFLDMDDRGREKYVARMLNLDPDQPSSWPLATIHEIIERAEKAADESVWSDCRRKMGV